LRVTLRIADEVTSVSLRNAGLETAAREGAAGKHLHEIHSMVMLDAPLRTRRGEIPAGTKGVVHDRKPDGSWYLVEFTKPFFVVTDVAGSVLRAAERGCPAQTPLSSRRRRPRGTCLTSRTKRAGPRRGSS